MWSLILFLRDNLDNVKSLLELEIQKKPQAGVTFWLYIGFVIGTAKGPPMETSRAKGL